MSPDRLLSEVRLSQQAGGFAFEYWCSGGDLKDVESLLISFDNILGKNEAAMSNLDPENTSQIREQVVQEIVQNAEQVSISSSVWMKSHAERLALVKEWQEEIGVATVADQAVELHRRHQQALQHMHEARDDEDHQRFSQQDVIGLTTTACAKYWPLLSKLDIRTVICEEAGEVIEPHSLCTLFPSIKHAIFIGDPLQLRAQVNEPEMAIENSKKYRLDESLFERMMKPSHSHIQPFPISRLNIQRRAHPVIADLMRATLYPGLEDTRSTKSYPRVAGMAERLYWLDHQHPEVRPDPRSEFATSYANPFEADMISAMVQYLVQTNEYNFGDIAVLTPYNGQLEALRKRLRGNCSIWLIQKDKEALMDLINLESDLPETILTEDKDGKTTFDVSNMLRLATIDNFQGEEAKIVILSTVRSNIDDRVGFLKSFNRINVACSRAKHGFYIIGNASLMQTTGMWSSIIDLLRKQKKIGAKFQACCSRHPTCKYDIKSSEDFAKVPPCDIKCGAIMPCGHICKDRCHTHSVHDRKSCNEKCAKRHKDCNHPCQKSCGEPCGECSQELGPVTLQCGHSQTITCKEKHKEIAPRCQVIIATIGLPCGHKIDQICGNRGPSVTCQDTCATVLDCGHPCSGRCSDCQSKKRHSRCTGQCGKIGDCGHQCNSPCHKGPCPPCEVPCTKSCSHGMIKHRCSNIPDPCTKPCQHLEGCSALCCLPCTRIASNKACTRILKCGHLCPSLEDETCPDRCSQCSTGQPCEYLQIYLPCTHAINVEKLDNYLGVSSFFHVSDTGVIEYPIAAAAKSQIILRCPSCEQPIEKIRRYSAVQQLSNVSKQLDELYLMFGQKLNLFMSKIFYARRDLKDDRKGFVKRLVPGPLGGMTNVNLVQSRGTITEQTEIDILKFKEDVIVPFEQSMSDLEKFLGHEALATLLRPSHLIPINDPLPGQLSASPRTPLAGKTSPAQLREDLQHGASDEASDTDGNEEGNLPDTAITREIMRQAKEREIEQRARSNWVVHKKPRPFNISSKPVPRLTSAEGSFDCASLPFKARLESLYYRCRLLVLDEGVCMIDALQKLEPRSRHTSLFLDELRSLITTQAQSKVTELDSSIANCASKNLKRLEVEVRLIQVGFHSILATLGASSGIDVAASVAEMLAFCEQYPDTAGIFLPACTAIKRAMNQRQPQNWNIDLYSKAANAFWKTWAGHEVGFLRHCRFGHPYSGFVFDDCPECGRYVEPKKQDTTDYSSYLKEDEFIAKMKQMRAGTPTSTPEK